MANAFVKMPHQVGFGAAAARADTSSPNCMRRWIGTSGNERPAWTKSPTKRRGKDSGTTCPVTLLIARSSPMRLPLYHFGREKGTRTAIHDKLGKAGQAPNGVLFSR